MRRVEQRLIGAAERSVPQSNTIDLGFMKTGDLPKLGFFFKGFPGHHV